MNNIINNWSYFKPTEPGDYLICWGDVETPANVEFDQFKIVDGVLIDSSKNLVSGYLNSYKFARLVYSPTEIKELDK